MSPDGPGTNQNWLRYQPPGRTGSESEAAKAPRMSASMCRACCSQSFGHDGSTPDRAVVEQHLAEAGHVAGRGADSTVVHRGSEPVAGDLGVVLCAHRGPDKGGHQVGHPDAGGPLAHPAQNVGVRRAVDERAAVGPLGGQRGEIGVQADALALGRWTPAHVALDDTYLGIGVLVGLAERDAGAHVEDVSHRGPVVPGAGDLRNVLRDWRLHVQATLGGKDSADTPHDGLRHRHQQMRRVGVHLAEIAFEDNLTVVQHDDGIGPRIRQDFPDGRQTVADPRHGDVVESRWVVGAQQRPRLGAPGDALRGNDLAQMLEGPPVEGRFLPVLQARHRLARWGESRHRCIGHSANLIWGLAAVVAEPLPSHPSGSPDSGTPPAGRACPAGRRRR